MQRSPSVEAFGLISAQYLIIASQPQPPGVLHCLNQLRKIRKVINIAVSFFLLYALLPPENSCFRVTPFWIIESENT